MTFAHRIFPFGQVPLISTAPGVTRTNEYFKECPDLLTHSFLHYKSFWYPPVLSEDLKPNPFLLFPFPGDLWKFWTWPWSTRGGTQPQRFMAVHGCSHSCERQRNPRSFSLENKWKNLTDQLTSFLCVGLSVWTPSYFVRVCFFHAETLL